LRGCAVADVEKDLKATSRDLVADAARLQAIETEKAALDPSDPKVLELSREAEAIAADIPLKTAVETLLAKHSTGAS
jgi:hypothetical protein